MAYDIASNQVLAEPVTAVLQGRALRRAEMADEQRMRAIDAAEGRAQTAESRTAYEFEANQKADDIKFDEIRGKKVLAAAQQVLDSDKPKALVESQFPEFIDGLRKRGVEWEDLDDTEVHEMAKGISARAAADIGYVPPAQTTGELEKVVGEDGKPQFVTRKDAVGRQAYVAPTTPAAPSFDTVQLGDGTYAVFDKRSGKFQSTDFKGPNKVDPAEQAAQQVELKLADDFTQGSKNFSTAADAYRKVKEIGGKKAPTPADDYALIYSFAKLQDPNSVVRETEFESAAKTGSYGDRIQNAVQRVSDGNTLTTSQRKQFLDAANSVYKAQEDQWNSSVVEPIKKQATNYKLNFENVYRDYRVPKTGGSGQVKPDSVQIKSDADYDALPSGATFIDPNGKERRKP